jgi:hypothetical protein
MSHDAWVSGADRALTMAAAQIRLIRAATPSNADSELAALAASFRQGVSRLPVWRYDAPPLASELPRALESLADFLDKEPPLGPIYAARARELCLEATIIGAIGTPRITELARQRFLDPSPHAAADGREADALADAWTASGIDGVPSSHQTPSYKIRTCDEGDPRSLVSRLAAEVGKKRLPVRVAVQAGMASLAATGDGVILVAQNQWVFQRDIERTVLHEIEGHALPRARASRAAVAIFAIGTAHGTDDQEGRAIGLEDTAGFLDGARRYELGCRHLAARATLAGADFVEVVALLRERHASVEAALRIAARVQRGGLGRSGLAREIVYLPSRCNMARLARGCDGRRIEEVMRGGRVAADVALDLAAALRVLGGARHENAREPFFTPVGDSDDRP